MEPIVLIHVAAGVGVLVLCVGIIGWGLARTREGRPRPGDVAVGRYHQAVALSWTLLAACGLVGIWLYVDGGRPSDPLHARVYGPFMAFAILAAIGFRTDDARWNMRVLAVTSIFILGLGVRALTTG